MTDSQLANDRTFLAWLRTGIALFGLGFVVAKVALIVAPGTGGASDQDLYSGVGVLVVLCGAALVLVGYSQHASLANLLAEPDTTPPRWPRAITGGAVAGSLMLAALIIVTT
jgi:putative membrane protein